MPEPMHYDFEKIRQVNPHDDPFVLVSAAEVLMGDGGQLVGAVGRWETEPSRVGDDDFLKVVYPNPGPFETEKTEAGLTVVRKDWEGFRGHFSVVPAVETLGKLVKHTSNDDDAVLGSLKRLQQKLPIRPGDEVDFEDPIREEDGSMTGTVTVNGELAMRATGLRHRDKGLGLISPTYLIESAAQVGSLAALSVPELSGKVAVLAGLQDVSFDGGLVRDGDTVVSKATLGRLNVSRGSGTASIEIRRERGNEEKAIGTIGNMIFFAVDRSTLVSS